MAKRTAEAQKKLTITVIGGLKIEEGDFVKFHGELGEIQYGVVDEITKESVRLIVGVDEDEEVGEWVPLKYFKKKFEVILSPADIVDILNQILQKVV